MQLDIEPDYPSEITEIEEVDFGDASLWCPVHGVVYDRISVEVVKDARLISEFEVALRHRIDGVEGQHCRDEGIRFLNHIEQFFWEYADSIG